MDFGLSDEQLMMQDTVRAVLRDQFPPSWVRSNLDQPSDHDPKLWSTLADMGLLGLVVSEEFGGLGVDLLDAALVAEETGSGAMPGSLLGHQLATLALLRGGSQEQKAFWLPRLTAGGKIATVAWAEPGDTWEPQNWQIRFEDGRVSGVKSHVLGAGTADIFVVGAESGRLLLVERSDPGVSVEPFDGIDMTRRLGTVAFDCSVSTELPNGNQAALDVRDAGLVLLAADAFGCASRLMKETIDYLDNRVQFGTRLTQFQGIKHELANMAVDLEPTRALWWYAAHAFDHLPDEAARTAAVAKAHICDQAMEIARSCVNLQGAMGFTWESPVHLWYKRIMFDRAFLGGPNHHRDRAAALSNW